MKVGFIGIGQMGRHMSGRILDAGYELVVHDVRREAAAPLLARGAEWAAAPREVARSCRTVITSLPNPQDVEQVVYGAEGLEAGWQHGDVYVDMSTNSPSTIRRIADFAKNLGVTVLDAPVSGGVKGAELGTLAIMVGGDPAALEAVHKVLEAMGSNIFAVGEAGCGNVAKLVNNMISLACTAATEEGFVLGTKAGIDPQVLWDIVSVSTGNSWPLQQLPETVFKGHFEPGFRLSLACKDIGLATAMGREHGVPLAVAAAAEQRLIEAKAAGLGDKSVNSAILRLEELAGVRVRSSREQ
ncbi:MAG: NAD(P)-dependent oxidoreductase [Chloroflexota bacterium]|nr:NAD(P)-dependent oxidoreductase [Chloroflexota bacterium]